MVNFEHVIAGWAISPILGKFGDNCAHVDRFRNVISLCCMNTPLVI